MSGIRTKLIAIAAIGGGAVGGGAIANAATSSSAPATTSTPAAQAPSSSSSSSTQGAPQGRHTANGKTEAALTGDVAARVKAASLAKVPGTVERVETNVDSSAPYEAHIKKSDGTEVVVEINSDYSVLAVNTMGQHP
jgi:hypothetical protein